MTSIGPMKSRGRTPNTIVFLYCVHTHLEKNFIQTEGVKDKGLHRRRCHGGNQTAARAGGFARGSSRPPYGLRHLVKRQFFFLLFFFVTNVTSLRQCQLWSWNYASKNIDLVLRQTCPFTLFFFEESSDESGVFILFPIQALKRRLGYELAKFVDFFHCRVLVPFKLSLNTVLSD